MTNHSFGLVHVHAIKDGGVNLIVYTKTFPFSEMMRLCKRFSLASKMPSITTLVKGSES